MNSKYDKLSDLIFRHIIIKLSKSKGKILKAARKENHYIQVILNKVIADFSSETMGVRGQ